MSVLGLGQMVTNPTKHSANTAPAGLAHIKHCMYDADSKILRFEVYDIN